MSAEQENKKFDVSSCTFSLNENGDFDVTPAVEKSWKEQGFFIVKGLFSTAVIGGMERNFKHEHIQANIQPRIDHKGTAVNFIVWNNLDNGLTGAVSRCKKVVEPFEKLLGNSKCEVYHYHCKAVLKDANGGGAFNWHQDYGYWYRNGCLSPELGTVWVPLDNVDSKNGCLKIVPGSHSFGRIEHVNVHNQVTADPERMEHILNRYGYIFVNMDAGDGLYFHGNILHSSDQNWSPNRRWAFITSYNPKWNDPVYKHHHPNYYKMEKLENAAVERDYLNTIASDFKVMKDGDDKSLTTGYTAADRVA